MEKKVFLITISILIFASIILIAISNIYYDAPIEKEKSLGNTQGNLANNENNLLPPEIPTNEEETQDPLISQNTDAWTVFITKAAFSGDLGGDGTTLGALQNVQEVCSLEATQKGLSGSYVPWISYQTATEVRNAKDYIEEGKFANIYGEIIANSKEDLLDGSIQGNIDPSINGASKIAWTGTLWDGTACDYVAQGSNQHAGDCNDWTGPGPVTQNAGVVGKAATDTAEYPFQKWSSNSGCGSGISCSAKANIYCFQISK